MPDLQFTIESAEAVQYAAAPLLAFKVRITHSPSEDIIHTVALRAQIQIEVTRRKYDSNEQARLLDLFGVAQHVVDSRERGGAALHRQRAGGRSGPVHL
jgi:hypothetical protein